MKFTPPLNSATLVRRYKRFLADVQLSSGEIATIHCPNTGSMKNCQTPNSMIWYSTSDNKNRKYPQTWQFIEVDEKEVVGINTGLSNKLVVEAIEDGVIKQLQGYEEINTEVPYGSQKSRIDIFLSDSSKADCFVEVKNVSLRVEGGQGLFPDAVTTRGQKHLQELIWVKKSGARALLIFCVQHTGIKRVSPADEIDYEYGKLLRVALNQGVEVLAYRAQINPEQSTVFLSEEIPVII